MRWQSVTDLRFSCGKKVWTTARLRKHSSSRRDRSVRRCRGRAADWSRATKPCRRARKRERRMQHPDEGTIHAWLDGALSPEEAAGVEAHINECAQCQSAVAEARGFIAASSRILTALDNVPRGVVPAAQPKRGIAPWVWRVAATGLVVAAGTLVVVRRTGVNQSLSANAPFRAVQRSTDSSRNSESAASPFPATTAAPSIQRAETSRALHDAPPAAPRVAATRP